MKNLQKTALCLFTLSFLAAIPYPVPGMNQTATEDPVTALFNEAFDDEIALYMSDPSYPIPGFAMSVVKGNESVFVKGYGDWENDSLIHIQSLTKTFTAALVLQLVEQGKLGLQDDINDYLLSPKRNPGYPDTPVTIHHCLTHQSSYVEGNWASYEPGTIVTYDNYNFFFLTDVIENITQTTFKDHMTTSIITPLGMTDYDFLYGEGSNGAFGLQLTPLEITKWLIVQLNNGSCQGTEILTKESIQLMHGNYGPYTIPGIQTGYGWFTADPYSLLPNINTTLEGHSGGEGPTSGLYVCEEHGIAAFLSVDYEFENEPLWWSLSEYVVNKALQLSENYIPATSILTRPVVTTTTTSTITSVTTSNFPFFAPLLAIPLLLVSARRKSKTDI